jgi:predicted Zn-dependent peptidase
MTLDRLTAPPIYPIQQIPLQQPIAHKLSNNNMLYAISAGFQPVMSVEVIFKAGNLCETKKGVASFAARLLQEGTATKNAQQIADFISFHGAFLQINPSEDRLGIALLLPTHQLGNVLPILVEMIQAPTYPIEELENFRRRAIQNYQVNKLKTAFLAGNELKAQIFGKDHPYGLSMTEQDYEAIQQADLVEFHRNFIKEAAFEVILAGNFGSNELNIVEKELGNLKTVTANSLINRQVPPAISKRKIHIKMPESVQASVRVGRLLFNRTHPDYLRMRVVNEILGGYFGSRLMKNIREDKGYTYGIYSRISTYSDTGSLVIGADVKKEFAAEVIEEIYKEMNVLAQEPVPAQELEVVRNYMLGKFLGNSITPFDLAEKFKVLLFNGLNYVHYEELLDTIKTIDTEQIMQVASLYLTPQLMTEVVVGGIE